MAFGSFEAVDVSDEFHSEGFQRFAKPLVGGEIAAQATRREQASQKPASCQPRVQLLGSLLKQLALGFADLERCRMAEMTEVVEMVVKALQLRQEDTKRSGANRRLAVCGALHCLTIGERMRDGSNRRDPLRHDDRLIRRTAFEARFHPAMLEEESRLIVDDVLPDIEEREFRGLEDVGANGSERQSLDVFGFDGR